MAVSVNKHIFQLYKKPVPSGIFNQEEVDLALDEIAGALDGIADKVPVVGSAAFYLNNGSYHRGISDIDLMVKREHLDEFIEHLDSTDFAIGKRLVKAKYSPQIEGLHNYLAIYSKLKSEDQLSNMPYRIKLFNLNGNLKREGLTDEMDIHIMDEDGEQLVYVGNDGPIAGKTQGLNWFNTHSGLSIATPDYDFLTTIKSQYKGEKHENDLLLLK